jgi:hypothetical protein
LSFCRRAPEAQSIRLSIGGSLLKQAGMRVG